jgi:dolichol kinase
MVSTGAPPKPDPRDPLAPLATPGWLSEAQRKAIHLCFIALPLELLHEWLPWPHGRAEWRLLFIGLVGTAIVIDLIRIHDQRVRHFFRTFLGELLREHESFNLLGSTYLLLASLLAIELFPMPMAAAAIGFTVLGDAWAAIVGRAWGRTRFFAKTLEGAAAGLVACLAWASYLAAAGYLPWSVAVAGALVASLVELLPIPLDDNLGMTLFAGYAMKLLGGSA